MEFHDRIRAIKTLRDLGGKRIDSVEKTERCNIDLKDAKDFVEAVMAFGVERYLRDELGKRGVMTMPEARDQQHNCRINSYTER